jgi:hypothetical protein
MEVTVYFSGVELGPSMAEQRKTFFPFTIVCGRTTLRSRTQTSDEEQWEHNPQRSRAYKPDMVQSGKAEIPRENKIKRSSR